MAQRVLRVIFIACFPLIFAQAAFAQEGGYVNDLSVTKGKTITFYISTSNPAFDLTIFRLGLSKQKVRTLYNLKGGIQPVRDSAFVKGCNWSARAQLTIPDDWKPGVYEADFPTSAGIKQIVFVVKEAELGSYAKTVVCLTVNTWQAYNNFGGKSLYGYNSDGSIASEKVSFDRPFSDTTANLYFRWTDKLVRWIEEEELPVEYCTNIDLDRDPHFLEHYDTYVTVGHDEYWSRPERNACKWLLDRAGRLIVLSGNTCWWQVRFENDYRTLVCYKSYSADPLHGKQDSILTCNWRMAPVNDSENSLIGVSFEKGGYVNKDSIFPASKGYGGYTVYRATNWIYEGTGVRDGDIIGQKSAIVGYETDGAQFWWQTDGMIYPTCTDGTPKSFTILGISPAADHEGKPIGSATMGYFTTAAGGAVFNAAVTDWVNGLEKDTIVRRMTHNIFHQFIDRKSMPPVMVSYSPINFLKDSINFQSVYLAHRTIPLNPISNDTLIVHAIDPMHKPLHYRWKIGFQTISTDSILVLKWFNKKDYKQVLFVSATVSNGFDSISMFWRLIDSSIRFWTYPPYVPTYKNSSYSYMPIAVSMVDERPKCVLESGPSWLKMDSTGTIVGTPDTTGWHPIVIRATDSHGNTTTQSFKLFIQEPLAVWQPENEVLTVATSPNPFTNDIKFHFDLKEEAIATIEISSVTGQHIRTLVKDQTIYPGKQIVDWDGTGEENNQLPAGLYFCRCVIKPLLGKEVKIVKKIVKL